MTGPVVLGAHVDQADVVAEAQARSMPVAQIFLGSPQSYRGPALTYPGGIPQLKADAAAAGVGLYVHAPYIVNVATANNRVRIPSRKLLQQHVAAAAELGALGVIVHGGQMGKGGDLETGFDNWRKAVDGLEAGVPVLIENTAGGDGAPARSLENLARLWDAVQSASGAERIGFCLDTCHAHAAGIPLPGLADAVRAITGRIDLVHANDSRDAFDSGADRHTNFGEGFCDPEGVAEIVSTAGAPIVVETPGGVEGQSADLEWLRERMA